MKWTFKYNVKYWFKLYHKCIAIIFSTGSSYPSIILAFLKKLFIPYKLSELALTFDICRIPSIHKSVLIQPLRTRSLSSAVRMSLLIFYKKAPLVSFWVLHCEKKKEKEQV